ncbi:hypothetical protein CYY_003655 [Polysphondylium violaceum]|uniref:Kinesin motor domain-containing protein n=1 Tax=Polysphondylium violaceum TaxID=133409 RepID=A0A8J4V024_9MYCE|nr:hypothetical protein CYY_003655 [Polysphondylium violaceum]
MSNNNNNTSNNNIQEDDDKIKVAIRVRPLNSKELSSDQKIAWSVTTDSITQSFNNKNSFLYDYVFGMESNTKELYDAIANNIVLSSLKGINGTIFAYGQTSSGKTWSMKGNEQTPGIITLSIQEIFNYIAENTHQREYLLKVSYLEIYNEKIKDLLSNPTESNRNRKYKIYEDMYKGVYVEGIKEEIVSSIPQVLALMKSGEEKRHIGATNMNDNSSRSHTIFRMQIQSQDKVTGTLQLSVLTLVDLAGSERISSTGAEGIRLKEGGHINKSLMTLSKVINMLTEEKSRKHIPYRESKLTHILQSSLGGNSKTAIICTITPAFDHQEESLSTLNFAKRAKSIKNNYTINELALSLTSQQEIITLKQELSKSLEMNSHYQNIIKTMQQEEQDYSIVGTKRLFEELNSSPTSSTSSISQNYSKKQKKKRNTFDPSALTRISNQENDTFKNVEPIQLPLFEEKVTMTYEEFNVIQQDLEQSKQIGIQYDDMLVTLEGENNDLKKENTDLVEVIYQWESENRQLTEENRQLAEEKNQINIKFLKMNEFLLKVWQKSGALEEEVREIKRDSQAQIELIDDYEKVIADLQEKYQQELEYTSNTLDQHYQSQIIEIVQGKDRELELSQHKVQFLEYEYEKMASTIVEYETKIAALTKENQETSEKLFKEFQAASDEFASVVQDKDQQLKDAQCKFEEYQQKIESLNKENENRIKDIIQEHQVELQELSQDFDNRFTLSIQEKDRQHKEKLEALIQNNENLNESLALDQEIKVQKLIQDYENRIECLSHEINQAKSKVIEYEANFKETQTQLQGNVNGNQILIQEKENLTSFIRQQEETINNLIRENQEKINTLTKENQERTNTLIQESQEKINNLIKENVESLQIADYEKEEIQHQNQIDREILESENEKRMQVLAESYFNLQQDYEFVLNNYETVKASNQNLTSRMETFDSLWGPLKQEVEALTEDNIELKNYITELESKYNSLVDIFNSFDDGQKDILLNGSHPQKDNHSAAHDSERQQQMESELEASKTSIDSLKNEIDEKINLLSKLENDLTLSANELQLKNTLISKLESDIKLSIQQLESKSALILEMESEFLANVNIKETELKKLEIDNSLFKDNINKLEQQIQCHQSIIDEMKSQISTEQSANTDKQMYINQQETQMNLFSEMLKNISTQFDQNEKRKQELESKLILFSHHSDEYREAIRILESENQSLTKISRQNVDACILALKAKNSQIQQLNESYNYLLDKYNSIYQLFNDMVNKIDSNPLLEEYNNLIETYNQLIAEKQDLELTINQQVQDIENLTQSHNAERNNLLAEITNLQNQLNKVKKAPKSQAEREKDIQKKEIDKIKEKYNALEIKYKQLSSEKSTLSSEKTSHEKEIKDLKRSLTQVESELEKIKNVKTAADVKAKEFAALNKSVETLSKNVETLKTNINELQAEITKKDADIQDKQTAITTMTSDLESRDSKIISLTADLDSSTGKVAELIDNKEKLEKELQDSTKEISTLKETLVNSESQFNATIQEKSTIIESIEKERSDLGLELKQLYDTYNQFKESTAQEKDSTNKTIKDLEDKIAGCENDIKTLGENLAATQETLDGKCLQLSCVQKQYQNLLDDIDVNRNEIEKLRQANTMVRETSVEKIKELSDEIIAFKEKCKVEINDKDRSNNKMVDRQNLQDIEINQLQERIYQLTNARKQQENDITELENTIFNLENKCKSFAIQVDSLEIELEAERQSSKMLEKTTKKQLEDAFDLVEERKQQDESRTKILEQELIIQQDYNNLKKEVELLEQDISVKQQYISKLSQSLKEKDDEVVQLTKQFNDKDNQVNRMTKDFEDKENQYLDKIDSYYLNIKQLERTKVTLNNTIKTLQLKIDKLESQPSTTTTTAPTLPNNNTTTATTSRPLAPISTKQTPLDANGKPIKSILKKTLPSLDPSSNAIISGGIPIASSILTSSHAIAKHFTNKHQDSTIFKDLSTPDVLERPNKKIRVVITQTKDTPTDGLITTSQTLVKKSLVSSSQQQNIENKENKINN